MSSSSGQDQEIKALEIIIQDAGNFRRQLEQVLTNTADIDELVKNFVQSRMYTLLGTPGESKVSKDQPDTQDTKGTTAQATKGTTADNPWKDLKSPPGYSKYNDYDSDYAGYSTCTQTSTTYVTR